MIDEDTGDVIVVETAADDETRRLLHKTIAAVRADMAELGFNTAIARLIELNNHLTKLVANGGVAREIIEPLVLMVAPLAPHVAEELWERLGHRGSLTYEPFPVADEALLRVEQIEIPVQINGKVRARVLVVADASETEVRALAEADPHVSGALDGVIIRKVVYVPARMLNFVVG